MPGSSGACKQGRFGSEAVKIVFAIVAIIVIALIVPLHLIICLPDKDQEDKDQEHWIKEWLKKH